MNRPAHQDINNPVCEGSNILPIEEWGWAATEAAGMTDCPGCDHRFRINQDGRIRAHRRAL